MSVCNPLKIADIEAIVMARDTATPRKGGGAKGAAVIRFVVDAAEVTPTPQASAVIVQRLFQQLGLDCLLAELGLEKQHGVSAEDVALVLLLFSSYGVDSVAKLEAKAQEDTALAEILRDVKAITEKVILYFEKHAPQQWEQLLDASTQRMQQEPRFVSQATGILALDDSPLPKTGKKMENISVIYDHTQDRYVLGYVLVSTFYADEKKGYPVNFQFRLVSEEERQELEQQRLRKAAEIDLRCKGSLAQWVELLEREGHKPEWVEVSGTNLESDTLKALDEREMGWLALPNSRTPLLNGLGNRWKWEELCRQALRRQPVVLETEGLHLHCKTVVLQGYEEVDFIAVTDRGGNSLGFFLHRKGACLARSQHVLAYLAKREPKDSNKLKIALDLVSRAKASGIAARTVACDAWYFVLWFVSQLTEIEGIDRVVSKLKCDETVVVDGRPRRVDSLWDQVVLRHQRGQYRQVGSLVVEWPGWGLIKCVFIRELDKCFRVQAQYVLVCTDTAWSNEKILRAYKLRWGIEVFYRTAKQRFGLEAFHHRIFAEIVCHVTFVFLAYCLTAALKQMNETLLALNICQIIDLYLRALVRLERVKGELYVFVSPTFASAFGVPS